MKLIKQNRSRGFKTNYVEEPYKQLNGLSSDGIEH